MTNDRLFKMTFESIYKAYVNKVTRKDQSQADLDHIIRWLTGYDQTTLNQQLADQATLQQFFEQAPQFNPRATLITGTICGVRVETIQDPLMQRVRYLDKLVDELAKGRPLSKILR